jgi:glyoxylase-like metal-dependent hydrolase (beta-lactamase superfamily II)
MTIKIHAIQTGTVQIKVNQTCKVENNLPQLANLFLGRDWTDWLPIYAWVIEHPEGLFVVDTGETARTTHDADYLPKWQPYYRYAVRFNVQPEDEIGPQMRRAGLEPDDVTAVILTHLHTDHAGGMHHFPHSQFLIHAHEWQASKGAAGWLAGYLGWHWPEWLRPQFMQFVPEAMGPFAESCAVTKDGRIRILPTPGRSPHHVSVAVQTDDVVYFLAGDTSYTQALMQQGRPDGVGLAAKSIHTLRRIQAFTNHFPTVYLPSHEVNSVERLREKIIVSNQ